MSKHEILYNMKNNDFLISKELKTVIKEKEKNYNSEELRSFEEAIKDFEELINKGLIKKRGYNLITIEEKHLVNIKYSSNFR